MVGRLTFSMEGYMTYKTIMYFVLLVSLITGCSVTENRTNEEIEVNNMNESSNVANLNQITSDDEFIYYINYNDGCKLYKVREDGSDNQIFANNSFIKIFYHDGVIYFTERINDNQRSAFSSIKTDGTDYKLLFDDVQIWNFVLYEDVIYAIGNKGDTNDAGFALGYLMSICLEDMKPTILDNLNSGYKAGDFAICKNKIYYSMNYSQFEYDINTHEIKEIPVMGDLKQEFDGQVYSVGSDKIYKLSNSNPENSSIIYQNDKKLNIRSLYVTDNSMFFSVNESNTLKIYKAKQDGSDLQELFKVTYSELNQNKQDSLYVINNKLFIFNTNVNADKLIIVTDIDGNEIWSY